MADSVTVYVHPPEQVQVAVPPAEPVQLILPPQDGKVEFRLNEETAAIEQRTIGSPLWSPLISLAAITGADGEDGASAYQLAVQAGFVGTEAEWLASLVGQKGENGTNGTNGTNGKDGVVPATARIFSTVLSPQTSGTGATAASAFGCFKVVSGSSANGYAYLLMGGVGMNQDGGSSQVDANTKYDITFSAWCSVPGGGRALFRVGGAANTAVGSNAFTQTGWGIEFAFDSGSSFKVRLVAFVSGVYYTSGWLAVGYLFYLFHYRLRKDSNGVSLFVSSFNSAFPATPQLTLSAVPSGSVSSYPSIQVANASSGQSAATLTVVQDVIVQPF